MKIALLEAAMLERPDAVPARYTVEGPLANNEAVSEDTAITLIHAGIRYPADERDGRMARMHQEDLRGICTDDVAWTLPGTSPISGGSPT
jgi:hypothetical protein